MEVAPAEAAPVVEPRRCECGCSAEVGAKSKSAKSRFRPGHDQRHRGNLLRAFDAGDEEAGGELIARNWKSAEQLIERSNKAGAKAAKKAKADAEPAGEAK